MDRAEIIAEVFKERVRQDERWGPLSERIGYGLDSHQLLAVLVEEVGECARALNDGDGTARLECEIVQVIAAGILWLEALGLSNADAERSE